MTERKSPCELARQVMMDYRDHCGGVCAEPGVMRDLIERAIVEALSPSVDPMGSEEWRLDNQDTARRQRSFDILKTKPGIL